jgi:nucleotide-binding universal stress UspA family protein
MAFMTYASLLMHMAPGEEAEGRLRIACELAARFDATLIGIDAAMFEIPVLDPTGYAAIDAEMIAFERQSLEAEFEESARKFHAAAGAKNLRTKWYSGLEFPADVICHHARAADLLVIGGGATASTVAPQHAADAGDILMQAGRPVIVVPPGLSELRLDHVVVAWKDTREARRAAADSIGLLKSAREVSVLAVCSADESETARSAVLDVVAYLARHRIAAAQEMRMIAHDDAAEEILSVTAEKQSDLIVCGGFGRGRMREWAFGGVTRELLKKSPVACLFSH